MVNLGFYSQSNMIRFLAGITSSPLTLCPSLCGLSSLFLLVYYLEVCVRANGLACKYLQAQDTSLTDGSAGFRPAEAADPSTARFSSLLDDRSVQFDSGPLLVHARGFANRSEDGLPTQSTDGLETIAGVRWWCGNSLPIGNRETLSPEGGKGWRPETESAVRGFAPQRYCRAFALLAVETIGIAKRGKSLTAQATH